MENFDQLRVYDQSTSTLEMGDLSTKEKAKCFIEKALSSLEKLKSECGEDGDRKGILDTFALCLKDYFSRQEIEARMLATHPVRAEQVGALCDELFESVNVHAYAFEAYEALSIQCASSRATSDRVRAAREKLGEESAVSCSSGDIANRDKLSAEKEAKTFIVKALRMLQELKAELPDKIPIISGFSYCVVRGDTRQEIEAYFSYQEYPPTVAETGAIYDAMIQRSGDPEGGQAYERYSIHCARVREEQDIELRRLANSTASTAGRDD